MPNSQSTEQKTSQFTTLRIVSDGTPGGTKIETEDGKTVMNVISISWDISSGKLSTATMMLDYVPADLQVREGEVNLIADPCQNGGGNHHNKDS